MPRQFAPDDLETVRGEAKSMAKGGHVVRLGNSLGFVLGGNRFTTFHCLVQDRGWTVEGFMENHEEDEVVVFISPITEVPSDD